MDCNEYKKYFSIPRNVTDSYISTIFWFDHQMIAHAMRVHYITQRYFGISIHPGYTSHGIGK